MAPSTDSSPTLRAPVQRRSQRTLRRLRDAASSLLDERAWSEITVQDIASRAGCSVGALYTRFASKDALLDHLDDRYAEEFVSLLTAFRERLDDGDIELIPTLRSLLSEIVDLHDRHNGLVRTLILRARTDPGSGTRGRTAQINEAAQELIDELCRRARGGVDSRSLLLAVSIAFGGLRERLLFPESVRLPWSPSREELIDATVAAIDGVLSSRADAP